MSKKLPLILSCLFACGIAFSQATQQQVVASSGGDGTAAGTNLQWTLGECVIQSSGVVAGAQLSQGFQQPSYEIQTLIEDPRLSFTLDVYPLPASDFLTIKVGAEGMSELKAVLHDMNGKIILEQNLNVDENQIDMQSIQAASYILNITDNTGKILKSFKIVKQ